MELTELRNGLLDIFGVSDAIALGDDHVVHHHPGLRQIWTLALNWLAMTVCDMISFKNLPVSSR